MQIPYHLHTPLSYSLDFGFEMKTKNRDVLVPGRRDLVRLDEVFTVATSMRFETASAIQHLQNKKDDKFL